MVAVTPDIHQVNTNLVMEFLNPHRPKKKKIRHKINKPVDNCRAGSYKEATIRDQTMCNGRIKRSYGIIVFWIPQTENCNGDCDPYYLVIQRRDTFEYVDFLRGRRYGDPKDMVSNMAEFERQLLLTYPYMMLVQDLGAFEKRYIISPKKGIECLIPFIKDQIWSTEGQKDSIYEFPKGRKEKKETPIECAIREFKEETCLNCDLEILADKPIIEEYVGSDGVRYSTHLFIARCTEDRPIPKKQELKNNLGIRQKTVSSEVSDVIWLKHKDTMGLLSGRQYLLLKEVDSYIRSQVCGHKKNSQSCRGKRSSLSYVEAVKKFMPK